MRMYLKYYVDEEPYKNNDFVKHLECPKNTILSGDIQQCGILTSVDSDDPVQPPIKLRNSK